MAWAGFYIVHRPPPERTRQWPARAAQNSKVRPWTRLSSQVTYQDCWIHLRSDRCRTADGKIIEPYHVLEYPDWVNLVAITKRERKLLLAREYRHGIGQIMPGLISGGLEEADSDTGLNPHEAAARRELEEETGYQGGEFSRILTSFPNPASHSNRGGFIFGLGGRARGLQLL